MEDIKGKKSEIRAEMIKKIESISESDIVSKSKALESKLFEFANFLEANIALLFKNRGGEFNTDGIIRVALKRNKVVVLPSFDMENYTIKLMKVDNPDTDLIKGSRGIMEPDPGKCKELPVECLDIAIIPGIAFDEKGGRIGSGEGFYDRFIPNLPITTRKVAMVFEDQIVPQVPMESHDKHVDIVITDKRVIYKI